jgi:MerR HTH family regulatory protein
MRHSPSQTPVTPYQSLRLSTAATRPVYMPEDEAARKEPLTVPPASASNPQTEDPVSVDNEVALSEAVKQAGVADRTLRRWLDKGLLKGRRTDSPYGVKWLVSLSEVKKLADVRGIGSDKGVTVSSDASTETGVDQATDDNPVETPPPGQMLVPQAEWERVMGQMASVVNLAGELGDAKEAKGRAEAMAEVYKTKLSAERDRYEGEIARWQREAEKRDGELQSAQEAAQRKRGWFRRRR